MHHSSRAVRQGRIRHNSVLNDIFEDPTMLGLPIDAILHKEKSPALLNPDRETIDLIIVAQNKSCILILLIEVKTGHLEIRDSNKAKKQLGVAQEYMQKHWQEWLDKNKIQPSEKSVILCPILVLRGNKLLIKDMCQNFPEKLLGTY